MSPTRFSPSRSGLALTLPVALLALLAAPWADAGDPAAEARETHRLGDHPAVVVQRLQRSTGYDYAAKFYPHPAWLYLRATTDAEATTAATAAPAARPLTLVRAGTPAPRPHDAPAQ